MAKPTSALVPAAARADTALTDAEQDLSAAAIDVFVKACGGKDALIDALAVADDAPEIDKIISLLLDPRYTALSLRRVCQMAGLSVADLFTAYKKAAIARAHIAAAPIIASKLAGVVADVMTRAQPYEIPCTSCGGIGTVSPVGKPDAPPIVCEPCRGGGKLMALPDLDRQKLALELGQLSTKGGGINLVQQNNVIADRAGSTAPGSLEQMQQAMGDLLFGRGAPRATDPPIDATLIDTPAPPAASE